MRSKSILYSRYFSFIKRFSKFPIVKDYGPTIFTLLISTILIFFAIKPTVETILVLQKKLVKSEEILQKVTKKANDLSLGKTNYDNLDQSIKAKIAAAITDTVSLKTLTQTLEETAKIHAASISALQVQPLVIDVKDESKIGSLAEASFIFNTEGSYENLVAFLQDLKVSGRLISIDTLTMAKANEGSTLIMSLSGKGYYLK